MWWYVCRSAGWIPPLARHAGLALTALAPWLLTSSHTPPAVARNLQLALMLWGLALLCATVYFLVLSVPFQRSRRRALALAAPALAAAPAALGGAAFLLARSHPRLDIVDLPVPGLPKDLDGLRIAQLTDLHFGAYFGERDARRAIALANETRPHLTVLTGDLVTFPGDDMEGVVRLLGGLKSEAGVFGCHGNHERNAGLEGATDRAAARQGIVMLRGAARTLRFGGARLRLAGVDYLPMRAPLPPSAAALQEEGAFNLLLCHNPGSFPSARDMGFHLTLAGHTHGGQLNLEIARANLNIALVYTPYVRGLYTEQGRSIYVSSGLGTVAAPVRLGAPPEVSLIRLCAA
jgi:predicted MPP superfamily phosphohydrolase